MLKASRSAKITDMSVQNKFVPYDNTELSGSVFLC